MRPRCRQASIQDVANELHLDWHTVKELDKQYMREQIERAGTPGPMVIGIDELSIRKRHTYRIVVSDLIRARPIWFCGQDRSEASMADFYRCMGEKKTRGIRLAVMDCIGGNRASSFRSMDCNVRKISSSSVSLTSRSRFTPPVAGRYWKTSCCRRRRGAA